MGLTRAQEIQAVSAIDCLDGLSPQHLCDVVEAQVCVRLGPFLNGKGDVPNIPVALLRGLAQRLDRLCDEVERETAWREKERG